MTRRERNPQLRPDIQATATWSHGRRYWLLRDPLSRRIMRISDADLRALRSGKPDPALLADAARGQLLCGVGADRPQNGRPRLNPLYIRLPGVNADRFLQWAAARTDWIFSRVAVLLWLGFVLVAVIAAFVYAHQIAMALPSFAAFFGPENWLPLAMTMVSTKILHELAHGIVCRRFGARCPEIGLLLLCGTPAMYCDVSDSWSLPSRFQRSAVMLAGVYIEAILASGATLVWMTAEPGTLANACLNVMFVCSVSTLLFNLNPLMRFDGYYVLSDVANVPNLRQRARSAWHATVTARFAGPAFRRSADGVGRAGAWLWVYHAAATAWRVIAITSICLWIVAVATLSNVLPIGVCLAILLFGVSVAPGVESFVRLIVGSGPWNGVTKMRRACIAAAAGILVITVLLVPLPRRISATGVVDFAGAATVFVRSGGIVESVESEYGTHITAGESVVVLNDADIKRRQIQLTGQRDEAQLRLVSLRRESLSDPTQMDRWDSQLAIAQSLEQRKDAWDQKATQLTIVSPRSGQLLPQLGENHLRFSELCGTYLASGDVLCRIGDASQRRVLLRAPAELRSSIEVGSAVTLNFAQSGVLPINTQVTTISLIEKSDPQSKAGDNYIEIECIIAEPIDVIAGTDVGGKISTNPESIWTRSCRLIRSSF